MPCFTKVDSESLKKYLYYSNIHDATIKNYKYDKTQNVLKIDTFNMIHDVGVHFVFQDVNMILFLKGNEIGDNETIVSLTVEEDRSCFHSFMQAHKDEFDKALYLLFQMFSGNEVHIVSDAVYVEMYMGEQFINI